MAYPAIAKHIRQNFIIGKNISFRRQKTTRTFHVFDVMITLSVLDMWAIKSLLEYSYQTIRLPETREYTKK